MSDPMDIVREFLTSDKRRQRLIWKLAREEAESVLRPMVRAEIEKAAPAYAKEYAEKAIERMKTGFSGDYEVQQAASRALARAVRDIEFVPVLKKEAK